MVMLSSGQHLKAPWPNRCCGVRFELAPVKGIGLAPSIGARRATKVAPLLQTNKQTRNYSFGIFKKMYYLVRLLSWGQNSVHLLPGKLKVVSKDIF